MDRTTKLKLAIHDYGTRDGATAEKIMAQLRKEGFSVEEIKKAVKDWLRTND